ncbi:MAG TPA: cupin domain-containing protein [Candidatus Saccharimonadales bacterium]|jgi:mannose-6-phosphate isomerase-like protein (cupin superfamily)|nr:cupin domain-containing protein [Candidatus Saccharimonadales bacterium]
MGNLTKKNFDTADESTHPADKVSVDIIDINGLKLQRISAQPGWKWSIDLKPVFKTDSCPVEHLLYMVSGKMAVKMDGGQQLEYGAGDIASIPPGHDGWGIGNEPTVWIEIPH